MIFDSCRQKFCHRFLLELFPFTFQVLVFFSEICTRQSWHVCFKNVSCGLAYFLICIRIIYLHQKKCARALKYLKTKITKKYREIRKVLGLWDCITLFLFSSSQFKKIKQNENETKRYRTWNSNEVLCIVFTIYCIRKWTYISQRAVAICRKHHQTCHLGVRKKCK